MFVANLTLNVLLIYSSFRSTIQTS